MYFSIRAYLFFFLAPVVFIGAYGQPILTVTPAKNQAITDVIAFYQRRVSSIRPDECPMYPSCSRYGVTQFATRPFFTALTETADRLLRCGHDHKQYGLYANGTSVRLVDTGDLSQDVSVQWQPSALTFAFADTLEEPASLRFIQYLMNEHYYDQALLEISRVLQPQQSRSAVPKAVYVNLVRCLKARGDYEKAIYEYEVNFPQSLRADPDISLEISQVWMQLKNYQATRTTLEKTLSRPDTLPSSFVDKLRLTNALSYVQEYNWSASRNALKGLKHVPEPVVNQVSQLLDKAEKQPAKKPVLAGVLAVVPGAGYFYSGHRQTALSALVLNSLLMYATYTTLDRQNYGLGALTGAFTLAFYTGNITGSVKSARRYNEQRRQDTTNAIKQLLPIN